MKKNDFLNIVKSKTDSETQVMAEEEAWAVFFALKKAMNSEDAEETIIDKLPNELKSMFEEPEDISSKDVALSELQDEDTVKEGHEPEEYVIT